MKRLATWCGLVAAVAVLAVACGGDDPLSDEAYFEGLEAVGAQSDVDAAPLFEPFGEDAVPDAETAATFLAGYRALFEATRAGTAALAPPSDLAAAHDAALEAMEAVIDEIERARARVEAGEVESVFEELRPAAFDEFFRACATFERLAAERGFQLQLSCADE